WCSPFCTEALQPTSVGNYHFGTDEKGCNAASLPKFWLRDNARNRIPSRVTVMTATPIPFCPPGT
ncbi:hypothetical protein, partial [Pseudomonas fluorescens]